MNSYLEANTLLGKRDSVKLENNTYLIRGMDRISVRLYNTHIITFDRKGGRIHLSTGSWNTTTTRDRLNRYMPDWARLYSDSGFLVLYIVPLRGKLDWRTGKHYLWGESCITLNPNRSVSGASAQKPKDAIREYKRTQARERYAASVHKRRIKHMLTTLAPDLNISNIGINAIEYMRFQSWRGPLGEIQEVCSVNDRQHFIRDDGAYFGPVWAAPKPDADPLDMSHLVSALDAFIPAAVRTDRSGWLRQGEFYFRPVRSGRIEAEVNNLPEAVCSEPLIEHSRHLLTGQRITRDEIVEQWGQRIVRKTTAFVIGTITAPNHPPLTLDVWHEVAYIEHTVD